MPPHSMHNQRHLNGWFGITNKGVWLNVFFFLGFCFLCFVFVLSSYKIFLKKFFFSKNSHHLCCCFISSILWHEKWRVNIVHSLNLFTTFYLKRKTRRKKKRKNFHLFSVLFALLQQQPLLPTFGFKVDSTVAAIKQQQQLANAMQ